MECLLGKQQAACRASLGATTWIAIQLIGPGLPKLLGTQVLPQCVPSARDREDV